MKKIIFFAILCTLIGFMPSVAQVRTQAQIQKMAQEHFSTSSSVRSRVSNSGFRTIPASAILQANKSRSTTSSEAFYVATANNGFVIISGDERMRATLGYSDKEGFDPNRLPDGLRWLLSIYALEFDYLQATNPKAVATRSTRSSSLPDAVGSLMNPKGINFHQNDPYNLLCPIVNEKRAVTGCVPTAMAMAMMYHRYPERALNNDNRSDIDITERPLEWDKIQSLSSAEDREAAAWLMLICGKTVRATYGDVETTAPDSRVLTALLSYFGYDAGMKFHRRDVYSTEEWEYLLKKDVSEGRPVVYGGQSAKTAGHCFILDGYDANNLFHINWGWGGSMNNYYSLTSLNPGFSGPGSSVGGFNVSQTATTGIQKSKSNGEITSNFIVFADGIFLNTSSIARGGTFTINRAMYMNQGATFTGLLQPALYKDGQLVSLIGTPYSATNLGYADAAPTAFENISIPTTIANGVYQLRVVTKDVRESQWQVVRMSQVKPHYYDVTVGASTVVFANPVKLDGLKLTSFKREGSLYVNYDVTFKLTLDNSGSEWIGRLGVQMTRVDDPSKIVVIAQDRSVFKVGSNEVVLYDQSVALSEGEYMMQSAFSTAGTVWTVLPGSTPERVKVEQPDLTAFNLVIHSKGPARRSLTEKDRAKFLFDIENNGAGPFSASFRVVIYNKSTNETYRNSDAIYAFIDKNSQSVIEWTSDHVLPDGDYYVEAYYTHNTFGRTILLDKEGDFTVRSLTGFKK